MAKYVGDSQIRFWSKEHFYVFDANIRQMEDQILWYREEIADVLAPSGFSYYLYERKVKEFRKEWERLCEEYEHPDWEKLEKHIRERMAELLKQDAISLEDYPENPIVQEVKNIHEIYCRKWMECLYLNAEIPE